MAFNVCKFVFYKDMKCFAIVRDESYSSRSYTGSTHAESSYESDIYPVSQTEPSRALEIEARCPQNNPIRYNMKLISVQKDSEREHTRQN